MVLSSLRCPAVQNERDCINSPRAKGPPTVGTLSIGVLLRAEAGVQQVACPPLPQLRMAPAAVNSRPALLLSVPGAGFTPKGRRRHQEHGLRGRRVRVHEASTPPAGGVGEAHPRVLQPLHRRQGAAAGRSRRLACVGAVRDLCVCSQVTLLRSHSAEQLLLGAARRSIPYNNVILLGRTRTSR